MTVEFHARLTPARRRLLDRLLDELLDRPEPERHERLAQLAERYPRLHRHLARLVEAAAPDGEGFTAVFERFGAAALSTLDDPDPSLPPGTRVGDWALIEPVGRGGMGQVYRAERADGAFEMQAAIKFIRPRAGGRLAERLAVERQLLARLDHPNIARLIDGGTLDDGRGYLVMEWIAGVDLSDARERLSARPRRLIERFIELAGAVAHAHQRRVVHGDIKPANVRLSPDGRVRLLDFGVARLITEDDSADGLSALTPAFSAPEQLAGEPASTQSDLYALGALLHWLLTGEPGAADARIDPRGLDGPRPAALAAILERTLQADPGLRYQSVPELIQDLRALLELRPVQARDSSALARLGLWSRRHRLAAGMAGLALASALVAAVGLAWQADRIRDERDAARFEAQRLALLREQMVLLFREAGRSTDEEVRDTRSLLAEAAELAARLYADDPGTRAAVQAFLGEIYIAMDDFEAAEPLLEAARSEQALDEDRLAAFVEADLAQIRLRQGASDEALALADQALARLRERTGPSNLEYIADVTQIRGQALRGLGRWDEAIATLREAHDQARRLPGPSRIRATTANNLATTLVYAGRGADALPYLERALDNWRGLDRADAAAALTVMGNLASLRHQRGDLADAEALYRETIRRRVARYGDSGALGAMHLNLGSLLATTNRIAEARDHLDEGVALIQRFEGIDSVSYTRALLARARVERAAGRYGVALGEIDQVVQRFSEQVGDDHLFTAIARMDAALTAAEADLPDGMEQLSEAIEILDGLAPASDRFRAEARCREAVFRIERALDGAGTAAERCMRLYTESLEVSPWRQAEARLLDWAARTPRPAPTPATRADLERVANALGPDNPRTRRLAEWLATSADGD
ncbi:serine/threonine protein kinase [Wenzhouxiangella sp. XN79A]|uniref:serine/threonine-protein kinase n=1 Tax=Wenzhouxiangella sp. XN79A TaxID=2724193 RepID=UPI00144ACBFC|nr:serine/threonine-protein kinase [Wenzhouxiangella sp. XN79A]NKI34680.1 serine/threonine protein kinase [Wenzhouxiangella sp. XN79A]